MILSLVQEAVAAGARQSRACEELGLEPRTLQRWRREGVGEDRRQGPKQEAGNQLSAEERQRVLALLTSPEYRDLPPSQIVPHLADEGRYVASEATMYRLLREEKLASHRDRTRPPVHRRPKEQVATGPGQVISWDITYLPSRVRGQFFFLYLFLDVWSRKILAARVFESEAKFCPAWLRAPTPLLLAGPAQGSLQDLARQVEASAHHLFQDRSCCRQKTGFLGRENETESANTGKADNTGAVTCGSIVEDAGEAGLFFGPAQDRSFSGSEIPGGDSRSNR